MGNVVSGISEKVKEIAMRIAIKFALKNNIKRIPSGDIILSSDSIVMFNLLFLSVILNMNSNEEIKRIRYDKSSDKYNVVNDVYDSYTVLSNHIMYITHDEHCYLSTIENIHSAIVTMTEQIENMGLEHTINFIENAINTCKKS